MIPYRLITTMLSSHNPTGASLAAFYPDVCQACLCVPATPEEGFLCAQCLKDIRFVESPICEKCGGPFPGEMPTPFTCCNCAQQQHNYDFARSSTKSVSLMRDVVHQYKFMSATWFEPFLMRTFLQSAVPALSNGEWDGVVSTPLHPVKFRERGFNQSDRLAICLAGQLQIPIMHNVLSRAKFTQPQSALPKSGRFVNVKDAFQANRNACLSGKKLILVDDVMTTGATVNACAGALKKEGVLTVAVWTLARGGLSTDLA